MTIHHLRLLIATQLALLACSCPIREAYQRERDDTRQSILAAAQPTTPERGFHVGLHLDLDAVQRGIDQLITDDQTTALRRSFDVPIAGRTITVDLVARIASLQLSASDACTSCLALRPHLELALEPRVPPLLLRAAGLKSSYALDTDFTLQAGVHATLLENGKTALELDLSAVAIDGVGAALSALPNSIIAPLRPHIEALTETASRALLARLSILELDPARFGELQFAVADIQTRPATQSLFVGLMLNLDSPPSPAVGQGLPPDSSADLRVAFSPQLPQDLIRGMLASGHLPDRFDADIHADPDGDRAVTLNSITPAGGDSLLTRFRVWRFGAPCVWADLALQSRVARDEEGDFYLEILDISLEQASDYEGLIRDALEDWRDGDFTRRAAESSARLLGTHFITLSEPWVLDITQSAFSFSDQAYVIDSTLDLVRGSRKSPDGEHLH